jgi:hypothetical protein
MTRRTLLRLAAMLAATWPISSLKVLVASSRQAAKLTREHLATLRAMADVVLPSSLSADDRQMAVTLFADWVANYREGAEVGPGYGTPRLRTTGPAPTAGYPAQLAALESSARAAGSKSFATLSLEGRRALVESALNSPQRVTQLPSRPTGANVIADFMGLYYHSESGYNLAYRAAINREECRGLAGSENAPGGL